MPKGDVPGEWYSPTQPFPVKTPPLSRTSMTKADIVTGDDTTPEHAAACQAMWDKAGGYINLGQYTPFMFHKEGDPPRSTIQSITRTYWEKPPPAGSKPAVTPTFLYTGHCA